MEVGNQPVLRRVSTLVTRRLAGMKGQEDRLRDRPARRLLRFLLLSPEDHGVRTASPSRLPGADAIGRAGLARRIAEWVRTPAYPWISGGLLGAGAIAEVLRLDAGTTVAVVIAVAAVATALAATLPLMWRRTCPALAGYLVVLASPLNFLFRPALFLSVCIGGLIGFYTLARHRVHHPVVLAAFGVGLMAVVDLLHVTTDVFDGPYSDPLPLGSRGSLGYFAESFLIGLAILAAVSAGDAVRSREGARRERAAAQEELIRLERHKAAEAERRAIARELHDIVSHSVSVIAVQAESATYTTPGLSPEGRDGFQQIAGSSREALNELRQLLNVLRSDEVTGRRTAAEAPQPTLDRLDELLARHRDGGGSAGLTVSGNRRRLPGSIELTAYRIVQEALTNVRRHAPRATAEIALEYGVNRLAVRVLDDGPGPSVGAAAPVRGHGLIGMTERVTLAGGRLATGRGPNGGFLVAAELPVAVEGRGEWGGGKKRPGAPVPAENVSPAVAVGVMSGDTTVGGSAGRRGGKGRGW